MFPTTNIPINDIAVPAGSFAAGALVSGVWGSVHMNKEMKKHQLHFDLSRQFIEHMNVIRTCTISLLRHQDLRNETKRAWHQESQAELSSSEANIDEMCKIAEQLKEGATAQLKPLLMQNVENLINVLKTIVNLPSIAYPRPNAETMTTFVTTTLPELKYPPFERAISAWNKTIVDLATKMNELFNAPLEETQNELHNYKKNIMIIVLLYSFQQYQAHMQAIGVAKSYMCNLGETCADWLTKCCC